MLLLGIFIFIMTCTILVYYLYNKLNYKPRPKVTYVKALRKPVKFDRKVISIQDKNLQSNTIIFWLYIPESSQQHDTRIIQFGNSISVVLTPRSSAYVSVPPLNLEIPYIPIGRWFQMAFTIDTVKGTATVYIDGDRVQTATNTSGIKMPSGSQITIGSKNTNISYFVSKVGHSDGILTQHEVRQEYKSGPVYTFIPVPFGLRWPLYKI